MVLGRIEAAQHRFHRWSKKSWISIVCFSARVEVLKFVSVIVINLSLMLFLEFQPRYFSKSLPGGNAGAPRPVLVGLFAGEHE